MHASDVRQGCDNSKEMISIYAVNASCIYSPCVSKDFANELESLFSNEEIMSFVSIQFRSFVYWGCKRQFAERYSPVVTQHKFFQGFRGTILMPSRDLSKHHPHFTQEEALRRKY